LESCPHLEFILRWCQVLAAILWNFITSEPFLYSDLIRCLCLFFDRSCAKLMEIQFNKIPEIFFPH
jgi:hypothetical protein